MTARNPQQSSAFSLAAIGIAVAIASASVVAGSLVAADEPAIHPGDRVAIVGNTFADQLRIHGYLETLLLQHYPDNPVSIRNLGWGGDMLSARDRPTNFPTEESTLTAHRTDVIVACFGMGESFAGEAGLANFRKDLEALIASHRGKKYNGETEVRLVLISPIAHEDLGKLTPAREKRNRQLEAYTKAMGEVAGAEKLSFVDLFTPSLYLMELADAPKLTSNGIHLNAHGYWALSHVLIDGLTVADSSSHAAGKQPWRIRIDAKGPTGEARGVSFTEVEREGTAIRFTIAEQSPPSLPSPLVDERELPVQLTGYLDTLIVSNLEPGDYRLSVDGESVTAASHDDWSKGVAITSSPAHLAAENYRQAINDKNLQFTYSWKALNQVHIVGERRSSPSGRALPAEVIEFNQLANERDKALRTGVALKTRQWRLDRIAE